MFENETEPTTYKVFVTGKLTLESFYKKLEDHTIKDGILIIPSRSDFQVANEIYLDLLKDGVKCKIIVMHKRVMLEDTWAYISGVKADIDDGLFFI